jgi:uncharacterized protein YcbK (DUF882 family)
MNKLKYFSEKEFVCDGVNCFDKMSQDLLKKLDLAREFSNTSFKITSSWRSKEHNAKVNGSENSSHLKGLAIDIYCVDSVKRFHILDGLLLAGFTRIGIAKNFIHVDVDESKPQDVIWTY